MLFYQQITSKKRGYTPPEAEECSFRTCELIAGSPIDPGEDEQWGEF